MLRKLSLLIIASWGLTTVSGATEMTVKPLKRLDTAQLGGYSMLVRKDQSVLARIDNGQVNSDQRVWWLVFNNPEACASRPCAVRDIYRKETRADLIPADEEQRAASATGDMCLQAGTTQKSLMPRFGMPASGLVDTASAEVQLIVGDAANDMESWIRRMSSSVMAGCDGGNCTELLVAIHTPAS